MATEIGTVGPRGRIPIPKDLRRALPIRPGDKILFELEGVNRAAVRKAEAQRLTEVLDRLLPTNEPGLESQPRLPRGWSQGNRRQRPARIR
ncbi:MAG: AbrB/MazE/SpoVT family DNA-binding domain-containing protein [Thermoplasmata archaeon]|nr:AbrB/MazE/SpoVT family DNA-binding domain-containing protein [Thermoplasmata archaeon]